MSKNLWDKIRERARDSARVGALMAAGLVGTVGLGGCRYSGGWNRLGGLLEFAYNLHELEMQGKQQREQEARDSAQRLSEAIQTANMKMLPAFFIDTGWEDGCDGSAPNGMMERTEFKNLNIENVENGTIIYVRAFNSSNAPVNYHFDEYENGKFVQRSQEVTISSSPTANVRYHIMRLERSGPTPSCFTFIGYMNNKEIGRREIYVLENMKPGPLTNR